MNRSSQALSQLAEAFRVFLDVFIALILIVVTQIVKVLTIICIGMIHLCRWLAMFLELGGIAACGIWMWINIFTVFGQDLAAAYLAFLLSVLMMAWGLWTTKSFIKTLSFMLFGASATYLIAQIGIIFASVVLAVGLALVFFAEFMEILPDEGEPAESEKRAPDSPPAADKPAPTAPKKKLIEQPDGSTKERLADPEPEPQQLPLPFPNAEAKDPASQPPAGGELGGSHD